MSESYAERGARFNARGQEVRQASQPAAPVLRVVETEPEIIDPWCRELSRFLRDESIDEAVRMGVKQLIGIAIRLARSRHD